jgi:hypothetical protein
MEAGYPAGDDGYPQQPYGQGFQQGQDQQPGGYMASAMPPGAGGAGGGGVVQGIPVWGRVQSYVSSEWPDIEAQGRIMPQAGQQAWQGGVRACVPAGEVACMPASCAFPYSASQGCLHAPAS